MDNIFANVINTEKMVKGAYKKLKSYLYYDKTLLFAKKNLALFESNRENFTNTLGTIAKSITNKNMNYFEQLISEINYSVFPKKFKSASADSDIINGTIDHSCNVSRINFFIDMPIELYIIDFLWTLLIGKIVNSQTNILLHASATAFKKSLYNNKEDLFEGIDFNSNRAFEPYYGLYTSWRNNAFETIQKNNTETDSLLLCLDLKSFYYSVDFDFEKLSALLNNDSRLTQFSFLTMLIQKIYVKYTNIIVKYKKGIKVQENNCIFPIGTISALILREIYLYSFDSKFVSALHPLYYKRYVDDILIVLKTDKANENNIDDIIYKYLINSNLVTKSGNSDLKFVDFINIHIQKDKINCFSFPKNKKAILLDIYADTINMNSSEANLLPDIDFLNSSFTNNAYNIENLDISNKIRELGFLRNNNYNATRFINSLLRLIKNTYISKDDMDKYFDQIEDFYNGSQSVEYSNNWRSIFELYLLCDERDRARNLYSRISNEIKKLNFDLLDKDELLEKGKKTILKKLLVSLKQKLEIVAALTTSLNYDFSRHTSIKNLAVHFRRSNLLNHTMVSYPLLNYSCDELSLTEKDISKLYKMSPNAFELDKFKLMWSPRFINTIEFFIANFIYSLKKRGYGDNPKDIHKKFVYYNNLGDYAKDDYTYTPPSDKTGFIADIQISNSYAANPKIALVNTNISKDDVLNGIINLEKSLTIDSKMKIFKILNTAKEEKVDILVFPEFYFPLLWLSDIAIFALKNRITLITGMQYITIENQVYNTVCNFIPTILNKSFFNGFMLFREKNFYAPQEVIELSKIKCICMDKNIPLYFRVSNGYFAYSTILCYEFTDISSRAAMKSKIELLFVPQLNKDTNYFSAIVESTARDLHCFVIQANTSQYGDSRITAPYKSESKNILQIKGGETDVVMIATLNVDELKNKRKTYRNEITRVSQKCLYCKKKRRNCNSCQNELQREKLKGTPPNFN